MIQVELIESNLWITLARPDKRNAISSDVRTYICKVLEEAKQSDDVRAITITGKGDAFCGGADLNELRQAQSAGLMNELIEENAAMLGQWRDIRKRTIAAVNGPAYGLGFLLAFYAKFVAASFGARFCMPEVKLGIRPRSGEHFVQRFGQARADLLLNDARELDVREAKEWGLVHQIVSEAAGLRSAANIAARKS